MDETAQILPPSIDSGTIIATPPASSAAFGLGPQEALEYRKRLRGMIGVADLAGREVGALSDVHGEADRHVVERDDAVAPHPGVGGGDGGNGLGRCHTDDVHEGQSLGPLSALAVEARHRHRLRPRRRPRR